MTMFSIPPPRTAFDLRRRTRSRLGLSIRQFSTNTLRQPPEISLPIVTPPCPSRITQRRTTIFSEGSPPRLPSLLRPDLMAMQSSPVSKVHPSINTSRQDSGSHPSLFGPCETISTPRTVTLVQSRGWISHIGEATITTPWMSTFRQRFTSIKLGRRKSPSPNRRDSGGLFCSTILIRRSRACFWFGWPAREDFPPFHCHQF